MRKRTIQRSTSIVYRHSCRPRGWQPPRGESTQKDTGADAPLRGIVRLLVSLFFSGILFSPRRAGREALFLPAGDGSNQLPVSGISAESPPYKRLGAGGNFSIEMASVSVNCSFLPGCLRQCDQGKNGCRKTVHGKGPNPAAGMRFSAPRDFIAQNPPSCFHVLLVEAAKDILRRSQPLNAPPSNAPP